MTIVNQVLPKNSTEIALSPKQKLFFARFATNKMMDAMLWVNSAAKIIWVNNAACSLTEYFLEELLSMTIYDLDLNFVELPWSKYQSDFPVKELLVLESFVRTKNGRKFPVKLKIASVNYDGQKYNCVLLQDTAEEKNAFNLEHKVQVQQSTALTNTYGQLQAELAKVRQKLNQKEQLDRQNTQLVSLVSHELRGPLNIISFANSLLQRYDAELSESKKRVHLNQIQAGVQQLNQLIDTMILIGKAKANKLNFQPQKIDLQQFCDDLVAQLQSCQEYQPEINFITTGNHREIAVDPQLLQSILRNLLDNASKYSALNSPIDLILEYKSRELIFQVKDRGVGIAKEDVPQLFEPFTRGKDCHHIKGSGLGLAIVKQLVEIHRGQIQVFSKLGLGTTIEISLPLI